MSDRVAVIGGGISGLAYAHVLRKNGFEPVVFEKASRVGGVWAVAYPGVRLQNVDFHYHLSDVPWPSKPDFHPTGEQIRAYWSQAVDTLKLDVRLGTEVRSAEERDGKWQVVTATNIATKQHIFDRLVVATGQYTEGKHRPPFDGEQAFGGWIGTERDVGDFSAFAGKRTVVVGFGKSALDVAALASIQGGHVTHVFRTPRWVLPLELLGIHATWFLFTRFGSVMMTAWGQPTPPERFLHSWLGGGVQLFWKVLTEVIRFQIGRSVAGTGPEGRKRLAAVLPDHPLFPICAAPRPSSRPTTSGASRPATSARTRPRSKGSTLAACASPTEPASPPTAWCSRSGLSRRSSGSCRPQCARSSKVSPTARSSTGTSCTRRSPTWVSPGSTTGSCTCRPSRSAPSGSPACGAATSNCRPARRCRPRSTASGRGSARTSRSSHRAGAP